MSKALWQEEYGGPEAIQVIERDRPQAGPDQIVVEVAAGSINPVDVKLAASKDMTEAFGLSLPRGFGSDFAGTVAEVGEQVSGFTVGERVFGNAVGRALAQHLVVTPGEQPVEKTPDGLSDVRAGSLSVTAPTAVAVIGDLHLKPGETVLIGGGSGNVGILAIQVAKQAGARVIATGSQRHHDFLRSLGAEPLTYGEGLVERVRAIAPDGIDAATDLVGTDTVEAAVALGVAPERITTIAAGPHPPHGAQVSGSFRAPKSALLEVARQVAAGDIELPIAHEFGIDQIAQALDAEQNSPVAGKVVVIP